MNRIYQLLFVLVLWEYRFVTAQKVYRICATPQFAEPCLQLQRGNSEVICQRVQDSVECAQRIRNNTAEFGIFTAESALLLAKLQWDSLTVVKELRHRDRAATPSDYESVVVVRSDHRNGLEGLRDTNICHPGYFYDKTRRWSERFLKHFERTVVAPDCKEGTSPAEIETAAFAKFFKKACRPGLWSNNIVEDARLKQQYPQLCELCSVATNFTCGSWVDASLDSDLALECLTTRGQVAYVSREAANRYLVQNSEANSVNPIEYAYLCPNGSKQSLLNNEKPCVWLSQPWNLIVAHKDNAMDLSNSIKRWVSGYSGTWEATIREIFTTNNYVVVDTTIQSVRDHFRLFRDVPADHTLCSTHSIWCTTSIEERDKCDIVRAGGITTGIYPTIECRQPEANTVQCLEQVSRGRADFVSTDSNFGFIARNTYNLTPALYAETENEKYASVVVVIRANATNLDRFEKLRGTKACFGEFGSIASVAFINTGKNRGFFSKGQCDYGTLLSEFFGPSCAPGALDIAHGTKGSVDNLCTLCQSSVNVVGTPSSSLPVELVHRESPPLIRANHGEIDLPEIEVTSEASVTNDGIEGGEEAVEPRSIQGPKYCQADVTNGYYGNRGALQCLADVGDVAILELQYLKDHASSIGVDPNDYRIMCKNGSLAEYTGFDVDIECALTTIVDGEVLVARNNKKTAGIINALNSFDKYFQNDPDFKIFNIFAGKTDLLFKDSSIGLVARDEEILGTSVENYRTLFENLDSCVDGSGASTVVPVFSLIIGVVMSCWIASITK